MRVDIGNALASVATPGISESALERLDDRVAVAHDRIDAGRRGGTHGYASLALPETVDVDAVDRVAGSFDPEAVLLVGIGGSALGAATLSAVLGPADADLYVLDNVDPAQVEPLLDALPLTETVVNVVSSSGTTVETLANFMLVRRALADAGVDWTDRTVVTTGSSGPLADLAADRDLPQLTVPEGVPGRYSVLSCVGLTPVALQGHDIEPVLAGARSASATLAGSVFDCPAYAYGAVAHTLECRGATTMAMMPYAEALEPFAEWFAQLWAESLGKDGLGQTPARALGTTDQHSQLQLYRAGRRDRLVTFVTPRERPELPLPATEGAVPDSLAGGDLGTLIDVERRATEESLARAGQPSVRVEIDRVDARGIGELLYGMEAACVLAGELAGVDPFTQPAVDWGKRRARELLASDASADGEIAGRNYLVE